MSISRCHGRIDIWHQFYLQMTSYVSCHNFPDIWRCSHCWRGPSPTSSITKPRSMSSYRSFPWAPCWWLVLCPVVWAILRFFPLHRFEFWCSSCKRSFLPSSILGIVALSIVQCMISIWTLTQSYFRLWLQLCLLCAHMRCIKAKRFSLFFLSSAWYVLSKISSGLILTTEYPSDIWDHDDRRIDLHFHDPYDLYDLHLTVFSNIHWYPKGYRLALFRLSLDVFPYARTHSVALS